MLIKILISLFISIGFGHKKNEKHSHGHSHSHSHSHGAHVHGEGNLGIALEKDNLEMEWKITGDSIVGFEHAPRNDRQQKRLDEALKKLGDASNLVNIIDGKCVLKSHDVEVDYDGGHSDFVIKSTFICSDILSAIEFKIFDHFSRLKKINLTFVSRDQQKSEEITKRKSKLEL